MLSAGQRASDGVGEAAEAGLKGVAVPNEICDVRRNRIVAADVAPASAPTSQ